MKKITCLFFCFGFAFNALRAQPVSQYQFSQASETYTPVTGTLSSASGDDGTQDNIDIGFPFTYGGNTFTTFSISTNGFIRLGEAIGGNNWINGLSNTLGQNVIAAFWDDDNRNLGSIVYGLTGTSPNQTLEIGWEGVNIGGNGTTNNTVSATFKIRLHETSNQIEIVYGSPMTWVSGITGSIGLNDLSSFVSVTPGTPASASSSTANNAILTTDALPGNKYVFDPPVACAGIPAPGATLASPTAICPGQEIILSMEGNMAQSNLSFQWQASVNGSSYTNIADGTTASITQMPQVATYYRCIVICNSADGGSAISTPVQVLINSGCYCIPQYTVGKTDGDLISNVAITGTALSNNTGTDPVNPSYTHFTGQPNYTATLEIGVPYEIQVTVGSYGQQNSAVWVDYNDDLQFDASERVGYTSAEVGSFGVASYTILLDCTAPAGLHRMRVRDVWNTAGSTIDPCVSYGYGETEDYDITVAAATGCAAPTNLTATQIGAYNAQLDWSSGCGQNSWDVHVALPGQGTPAGTISNPGVTNPVVVTGLEADTAYEFYVRAHCDNGGTSDWAGPFAFTTGPVPPANDDCAGAYPISVGGVFTDNPIVGSNVGASTSLTPDTPACAAFNFGGDVWFSVVVPASGSITVEIQADAGSPITDTGMSVYSGTCDNLTALGCSDDEGTGAFSMMALTGRTPGETLYIRIWEYANDSFGTFRVSAYDASLGLNISNTTDIVAYPNPVGDVLHFSGNTIDSVSVYNMLGQRVIVRNDKVGITALDMSALSAGAYLVRASSGAQEQTFRIVKK